MNLWWSSDGAFKSVEQGNVYLNCMNICFFPACPLRPCQYHFGKRPLHLCWCGRWWLWATSDRGFGRVASITSARLSDDLNAPTDVRLSEAVESCPVWIVSNIWDFLLRKSEHHHMSYIIKIKYHNNVWIQIMSLQISLQRSRWRGDLGSRGQMIPYVDRGVVAVGPFLHFFRSSIV